MKVSSYAWGAACLSASMLLSAPVQQAAAQSAAAQSMLEEVVVTARRREETLTDLPLSVAAISADVMAAQGIYNIDDVGEFVPNLTYTNTDRRHVKAIYIRGIGNDSPVSIRPSGTGVYLDGAYLPNTMGQMLSTADIERIEVLRGPQGTLFGKNTTGGAINVVTAKPGQEFEADVLLRAADYGQTDFKAMVNVPFSDTVAGRFTVMQEKSDGQMRNLFYNRDAGGYDVDGFSAAFRFTPNDNWTIDLSARANYQDDQDEGVQCRVLPDQEMYDNMVTQHGTAVSDVAAWAPEAGAVGQWGGTTDAGVNGIVGHIDRMYSGATLQFWNDCLQMNQTGPHTTMQEKDTFLRLDNEFYNATIAWDSAGEVGAFDNINFKTIVSGQRTDLWYFSDRDGSSLSIDALGGTGPRGARREVTTVEGLLTADLNDRLSFIAGYHYFDDEVQSGQRDSNGCLAIVERNIAALSDPLSGFSQECSPDGGTQFDRLADREIPGGPGVTGRDGYEVTSSDAVFAHLTYQLNDNWSLDAGFRWTEEQRIFHQLEFDTLAGTCSHTNPGDAPITDLCAATYILDPASFSGGFYNNAVLSFSETTPMISLSRSLGGGDVLEDGMFYVSYSEGFLAGSFNDELNARNTPELEPLLSYQPENVTNYEFGFKGTFADGSLRLSSAIFYMDYINKQETVDIQNPDGTFGPDPFINITTNAATVDIYGLELEARWAAWDGGFITFDFGWLDNQYGEFSSFDPNNPGTVIDQSDVTIEDYSPEFTLNASVEHVFNLGNGATITPRLGIYWQDEYNFQEGLADTGNPYCLQDAYTKLRGRVTYQPASANWQASLYGSNMTDEVYYEICGDARSGVFDYRYGDPEVYGLEFQYFWGN